MPPLRAGAPGPPLRPVRQVDRPWCADEDEPAGDQVLRVRPRELVRFQGSLRDGQVAGVGNELGELGIGDRVTVDAERPDPGGVDRPLVRVEPGRAVHPDDDAIR